MAERRTHPNGGTYERGPDGQWHLVQSSPMNSPFAPPGLQYQVQRQQNEAAASQYAAPKAQADAAVAQAQAPYAGQVAEADARKAEADARRAEAELQTLGKMTADKRTDTQANLNSLNILEKGIDELSGLYQKGFQNQGLSTPLEYAPGGMREVNGQLNDASWRLASFISKALELTGKQFDTPREQQLFIQSYLPQNTDRDGQIESKISALTDLLNNARRGMSSRLGTEFKEYRNPLQAPQADMSSGNADYSGMQGGGNMQAVAPGSPSRTEPYPEASAFLDGLIRQRVPYGKALRQFRERFPQAEVFSPREYNRAVEWRRQNPNSTANQGSVTRTIPMSFVERVGNAAVQTAPGAFVGHHANAIAAGIPSYLAGEQGQFWDAATRQQHPTASLIGDVTGAVGGTFLGNKALKPLNPIFEMGKNGALNAGGRRMLAADTLYGGTFGATQNPDDPLTGAAIGVGAMGAGNAVGRYTVGPALRAAGDSRVGQWLSNRGAFSSAPALPSAESALLSQTKKAGFDEITGRLQGASDLNMPYALADADPRLRMLAGSATRKSPDVRKLAEDTIGPRQQGQAERAIGLIDSHLAPSGDLAAITGDATSRARAASGPLYAKAMSYPAPKDEALSDLLRTPASEAAAREAYSIALNEGVNPAELSFATGPNGPIINANPNWKTLHYMRQGFDSVLEKSRDGVSGKLNLKDPGLRALNDLRSRFSSRLHALNPDFASADAEFAKYAGQGSAAQRGYSATGPRVTPDQTANAINQTSPEHLPFYQQGYASSMADTVERGRLSGDPYNMIYGSPAQQQKLGTVFPQGAPAFSRARGFEADMSKTAYETLGGSPTASRLEADSLFNGDNLGNAVELGASAMTGAPPLRMIAQTMPDIFRMGMGKAGKKKADKIGPLLLDTDPKKALSLLTDLAEADRARRAYIAQARRMGGMFGGIAGMPLIPSQ